MPHIDGEKRMGSAIDVQILAAESLGTRSMATKVTTSDITLLIDSGVALGPRFGLLPHPLEYKALAESRKSIRTAAEGSDICVITHYHHDHYSPPFDSDYVWTWSDRGTAEALYRDKIVLVKDSRENINPSQRVRAFHFNRFLEAVSREVRVADSSSFKFGETRLEFSKPVPHGEEGTRLGYVIMLKVSCGGDSFLFASDVQGPISDETRKLIIQSGASTVYIGGPPAYLVPFQVERQLVDRAIQNLSAIAERTKITIVDHHLMRTMNWMDYAHEVETSAKASGNSLVTAASFSGKEENLLEARRDQLYREVPPGKNFITWTRKKYEERRSTPPPL